MTNANDAMYTPIDPALIAAIVRKVMDRLQQTDQETKTDRTAISIADKVVSQSTIEKLPGEPSQVFVAPGAVVTPAARDAARDRGIEINNSAAVPPAQRPNQQQSNSQEIIDPDQPERAHSVISQLKRRGIEEVGLRIVLSDTPAAELQKQIAANGCRGAMLTRVTDVERFQRELAPQVWVLDMGRMNLTTAVNTAARIAQLGN